MGKSSNKGQHQKGDFTNFGYNPNDFNRKVPFEIDQPSPFTTTSYFPPLLPDKRSSWKSVAFRKSSSQPIRLSILKLDGSSFDIIVTKKATVGKVKEAVEAAFSHLPMQGDGKISWSHVWGHFCLCFEHMKLLRDRDPITRYRIQNGDQLQFVRYTPIYIVAGETSEMLTYSSDEIEGSSISSDLCGDMKNKGWEKSSIQQNLVKNKGQNNFGGNKKCRSNWASTMRGLFTHRRQDGLANGNDRAVNSTVRLGQPLPCDDVDVTPQSDVSCRLSAYSPNSFNDFVGGFGYPTGYCLK